MHHATVFWGILNCICLQFTLKTTLTGKSILRKNVKCFCMWWFQLSPPRTKLLLWFRKRREIFFNLIEKGHFKLLNKGHYTYQSVDGKSRNMLDLHFCDSTVFTNFNNFEVSEDLGSDHRTTITTLNLKISRLFELKSKIDLRIFKENTRKS